MNPLVIARNLVAGGGAAGVLYLLARKLDLLQVRGDDAPIRVKGGSVKVWNDYHDWVTDKEEGHGEYHYQGRPKQWRVEVWKNESDHDAGVKPLKQMSGRRAILHVSREALPGFRIVFRPNGAARVIDPDRKLMPDGKMLEYEGDCRLEKIVVKDAEEPDEDYEFKAGEPGYIKLTPRD